MKRLAAGLTLMAGFALPCTALASGGQQSSRQQGNQANPGSPAGQEYVIPIAAARSEAAGGSAGSTRGGSGGAAGAGGAAAGGASGSGSGSPPLFGIGVAPSPGAGANRAASKSSARARVAGRDRGKRHGSSHTGAMAAAGRPVSLASVTRPGSAGGDGWLALVGGGLLVLIVGGGAGIAVRRRLSGS